jgi:hypothetical protein
MGSSPLYLSMASKPAGAKALLFLTNWEHKGFEATVVSNWRQYERQGTKVNKNGNDNGHMYM